MSDGVVPTTVLTVEVELSSDGLSHQLTPSPCLTYLTRCYYSFFAPLNQSEACRECVLNVNDTVDDMEALEKTSQAFLYFKAIFQNK